MVDQVKCPECEGFQVSVETQTLDPASGKQFRGSVTIVLVVALLLFGLCMLVGGFGFAISEGLPALLFVYIAIAACFIVPGALQLKKFLRAVTVNQFQCSACDHHWTRRIDEKERIKCPACGETDVLADTITADRKTGNKVNLLVTVLWGIFAIVLIGGGLSMAILAWKEGDTGIIRWTFGSTIAGFAYLAIGISVGRYGVRPVLKYYNADRTKLFKGRCLACKYEWKQWEGEEPEPLHVAEVSSEESGDK